VSTTPWRSSIYTASTWALNDGRDRADVLRLTIPALLSDSHFRLCWNHRVSFGRNRKRFVAVVSETNTNTKPVKTPVSAPKTKTKFGQTLVQGMTLSCIHIFIVTGSVLYCCDMRPASQRFFIHSCIFLRILIISYFATFLGTNSLSVLMCRKAVNQSI